MVRVAAAPRRFVWPVVLTLAIACSGPPPGVTELDVVLFGSDAYDGASAVVADAGGWMVGGSSYGTIAGEQALGSAGFVAAFDARGAARWSAVVANTGLDLVEAVGWSEGARWAAGVTWGTLPGQTASGPNDGTLASLDGFVVRLDEAGAPICLRQFGSDVQDDVRGLAVLPDGGVVVVGATYGTLPGTTSQGGRDAFAVRLDGACEPVWARQFGGPGDDAARAVAVLDGVLAIAGVVRPGAPVGEAIAEEGPFASAWTLAGELVWGVRLGGAGYGTATGVAIEPNSGDLFVGGWTEGEVVPGAALGERDGFVARVAPGGALRWARHVGTDQSDHAHALALLPDGSVAVAVDGEGRVAVVGYVEDGLGSVPSLGGVEPWDAFLVVLRPPAY